MASNQNVNKVVYAGTTLIDLTGDDVTAASVLSGKKFHLPSGAAATGTIATKAAATYYPSASDQSISASRYLNGAQTIKAVKATNLTAANIKSGVTVQIGDASDADRVMSVTGSYTGTKPTLKIAYHQSGSGTATGDNIRPLYPGMTLMAGGSLRVIGNGTLNLETGVLTTTTSYFNADNSNFSFYNQQPSFVVFRANAGSLDGTTVVSNMFTQKDDNPWKCIAGPNAAGTVYLYLSIPSSLGITTSEDFATYLKSHNFILFGSRKTAATFTLTQSELAAIIQ